LSCEQLGRPRPLETESSDETRHAAALILWFDVKKVLRSEAVLHLTRHQSYAFHICAYLTVAESALYLCRATVETLKESGKARALDRSHA
jgi:hypothetical protein